MPYCINDLKNFKLALYQGRSFQGGAKKNWCPPSQYAATTPLIRSEHFSKLENSGVTFMGLEVSKQSLKYEGLKQVLGLGLLLPIMIIDPRKR